MKNKKNQGFSLAEIVVAIFVIGLTSSASYIITSINIRSQIVGQDFTIASNLAREGIEVVRGIRDSNWLYYSGSRRAPSGEPSRDHWNDGFDGVDSFGQDYNTDAVGIGNLMTEDINYNIKEMTNHFIPILDYNNPDIYEKNKWNLKYIANNNEFGDTKIKTNRFPIKPEYLVYQLSDVDGRLYVQNDAYLGLAPAGGSVTKYYRILDILYQESYDQGGTCIPIPTQTTDIPPDFDSLGDEDPSGDYNYDGNDDDDLDGGIIPNEDEDGFDATCHLNANDNKILVRSKVYWYDYQGNLLNVELETTLTDWFRREDHT